MNQTIHLVTIPAILWSLLVWLSHTPSLATIDVLQFSIPVNMSVVFTSVYALYYLSLNLKIGVLATAFIYTICYNSNWYSQFHKSTEISIAVAVLAIFAQLAGHKFYEKRAPAFLSNPIQAIVLAPLFVFSYH